MTIFRPFRVWIRPNWDELLKDHKLLDQFLETQKKESKEQEHELSKFDVITDPISFTVLRSEGDGYLIYNNNHNSFHTEVNIRERIEKIKFPLGSTLIIEYSPDFWIKGGVEGYNIGITTPESFEKAVGHDNGIKIATIPYSLFGMPKHKLGVVKPDQLGEQLKKNGWVQKELDFNDLMDLMDIRHTSFEIKHKYLTVYYQCI